MYIPLLRERVRMRGAGAEYLVTRADYSHQVADLASTAHPPKHVSNVPFNDLFAAWENPEAQPKTNAGEELTKHPAGREVA